MKELRKIAFFIGSLAKGGAEKVVLNLAEYFHNQGCDICIMTAWTNAVEYPLPEYITRVDVSLTKAEMGKKKIQNEILRAKKRKKVLKEFAPDILVAFIKENNFRAILTAKSIRIPVVVSIRSAVNMEYPKRIDRFLMKLLFPLADGIVLQTQDSKRFFTKRLQKKITVLPNSLNPLFIRNRYEGERKKEIVTVGRIDDNKNQQMLVEAFEELAERANGWKCVIYGDGEKREDIRKYVQEKGLGNKILLPGNQADIYEKIYQSNIFVLTSYFEGMPNALIEAMALGLAVISTDCVGSGPKELIRNNENGILIPVGDKKALKEALLRLIADKELEKELGVEAAKIVKNLNPDYVNSLWKTYLTEIVNMRM